MKASALEFRFRYVLHALVFVLGFTAPWDRLLGSAPDLRQTTWLALASAIGRQTSIPFVTATISLLVVGIVLAAVGAWLRVWGSAYLGASTVKDGAMLGGVLVADGPYRHVRNPLYLGTWLHAVALALLMPPTGAVFAVLGTAMLEARLIAGEEPFLRASVPGYAEYCARVPRIVPSLVPRVAASGARPRWLQAMLGEIYMIGVAVCFAVFGWRYNAFLLIRCVLVCVGVSLVVRALWPPVDSTPKQEPAATPGR